MLDVFLWHIVHIYESQIEGFGDLLEWFEMILITFHVHDRVSKLLETCPVTSTTLLLRTSIFLKERMMKADKRLAPLRRDFAEMVSVLFHFSAVLGINGGFRLGSLFLITSVEHSKGKHYSHKCYGYTVAPKYIEATTLLCIKSFILKE